MKASFCLVACVLSSLLLAPDIAAEDEMKEGLVAQMYQLDDEIQDFPTIAADKKPTVTRVDKQVNVEGSSDNWPGTDLREHFFIRWTGVIKIAKDGKYKFFTESDDGSRLFIDGKRVVNNGGVHGMYEQSGQVELKAGDHEVKLEFYQNGGEVGCKLLWQPPDAAKEVVPASVLTHKKSAE